MSRNARNGKNGEFGKILPWAQKRQMWRNFVKFATLMQMSKARDQQSQTCYRQTAKLMKMSETQQSQTCWQIWRFWQNWQI